MTVRMYRPDGAIAQPAHRLSPKRPVLSGARIGVLDNGKPNAGLLMTIVAEQLSARAGSSEPVLVLRKNAAKPCPDDVMDQLKKEVDLVITGSAD
jgi:hypothetical protein